MLGAPGFNLAIVIAVEDPGSVCGVVFIVAVAGPLGHAGMDRWVAVGIAGPGPFGTAVKPREPRAPRIVHQAIGVPGNLDLVMGMDQAINKITSITIVCESIWYVCIIA